MDRWTKSLLVIIKIKMPAKILIWKINVWNQKDAFKHFVLCFPIIVFLCVRFLLFLLAMFS